MFLGPNLSLIPGELGPTTMLSLSRRRETEPDMVLSWILGIQITTEGIQITTDRLGVGIQMHVTYT